ncbi:cupin domain-containing protein [Microbacter margulisiae]|uniref:Mannose-6-phosphate isomerase-like protein (Cupin superfamily) n=1 Tax=Microbacter margulisiae TaxID=1350067 RepID=A0A7W5DQ81_9PORP|nr:cupin domain-containing protein [Microbacter margulisiae]MBB3186374.1 mannose-6-phosphate isomerase-like protein (cupin superfamily) [Microbacter margulisiae]MBB3186743.1 mannose-6-phosphate isomerase-like protein (cupin superfamily) [Microbacter margulisiae]
MKHESVEIISTYNAEHYTWGDRCSGWYYLNSENIAIIRECMPPATKETLHYHRKSHQFFYILSGVATFEIDGMMYNLEDGEGVLINPGIKHRIINNTNSDLKFLVISEPPSHGDRVNPHNPDEIKSKPIKMPIRFLSAKKNKGK